MQKHEEPIRSREVGETVGVGVASPSLAREAAAVVGSEGGSSWRWVTFVFLTFPVSHTVL